MQAKSVMYAAVGAPVVAVRKVGDQMSTLKGKLDKETANYGKAAEKAIKAWAAEGEKVVNKISEGKVVEEISSKVDLDQAKVQVTKLRDQLEDMLATWRTSFRPEKASEKAPVTPASTPAAKKPAAKATTAAKKPVAKKPAAKASAAKTTKSATAAKASTAKTPTANAAKAS
ncbi:MAG: hypothetical protein WD269_05270 [Acidimicrobiia bacterium]